MIENAVGGAALFLAFAAWLLAVCYMSKSYADGYIAGLEDGRKDARDQAAAAADHARAHWWNQGAKYERRQFTRRLVRLNPPGVTWTPLHAIREGLVPVYRLDDDLDDDK